MGEAKKKSEAKKSKKDDEAESSRDTRMPESWRPSRDNPTGPDKEAVYRLGYIRPDNAWVPLSVNVAAVGHSEILTLLKKEPEPDRQGRTPVIVRWGGEGDAILYKWVEADKEWVRHKEGS